MINNNDITRRAYVGHKEKFFNLLNTRSHNPNKRRCKYRPLYTPFYKYISFRNVLFSDIILLETSKKNVFIMANEEFYFS